jgi:hypothetical protein
MEVERQRISYTYRNIDKTHFILVLKHRKNQYLLSEINLYLKDRTTSSSATSDKYSRTLLSFIRFLIKRCKKQKLNYDIWRKATNEDLLDWQGYQVKKRDQIHATKPSDATIYDNAKLVHLFYIWASKREYPVAINNNDSWKYDYRANSKFIGSIDMISVNHSEATNSKAEFRQKEPNKKLFIMSNDDIKKLMQGYKDPVYAAALMLSLATGMREEGVCSMPYIGKGKNSHICPYPEILSNLSNENNKTFDFTVTEKGVSTRTLQVNLAAWKSICLMYLPLYFERLKLYKKKHRSINHNNVFFLKKNGEPITPKNIADQTYLVKKTLKAFPWTFHSARAWYATKFIIRHQSKEEILGVYYNSAVEDQLKKQMGHKDYKTTYTHYMKQASLILHLKENKMDFSFEEDDTFFSGLCRKFETAEIEE